MAPRITAITDGQRAQLAPYAEAWIERVLATGPADRSRVEDGMRRCYEAAGLRWHGRVVWVESPTNPTLDVADLPRIAEAARAFGATVVVDSTFATPMCARPLEDGATVVIHSGTKFIGGHSDLVIGLAVTSDDVVHDKLRHARLVNGATPGSLEAFLALRGVRTLPLRMERAQANAAVIVERLRADPRVSSVRYPGWGAMVAFEVAPRHSTAADAADAVCRAVQLIVPATSLGGVETTLERRQKYAGDSHVPPGLIRMSVGIEHVDDVWADLDAALG